MGYGAGGTGGGRDLGFRKIVPQCEPGPDYEACRHETIVGVSVVVLVVVAAVVLVGSTSWLVLSGRWSLMLISLEQKIRSLRRQ